MRHCLLEMLALEAFGKSQGHEVFLWITLHILDEEQQQEDSALARRQRDLVANLEALYLSSSASEPALAVQIAHHRPFKLSRVPGLQNLFPVVAVNERGP